MRDFAYHKPTSLAAAAGLLVTIEDARVLAGGMTLLPTMKQRLAAPEALVDLAALQLAGIAEADGVVTIGAMTRHADVAASGVLARCLPGLAALAGGIGDPQVRHRGTIGGSVANNDPAADYPAALLALGAEVVTDRRAIAAADFFVGLFETALEPGEIITTIRFPAVARAAYAKFRSPASRYALAGVFVAALPAGVRVAVTGAGPSVFRLPAMEAALDGNFTPEAAKAVTVDPRGLNSDIHADAVYRAHLVGVMAARAVAAALAFS
jgi:carbon-monoxide dehydrogenase medium subunit